VSEGARAIVLQDLDPQTGAPRAEMRVFVRDIGELCAALKIEGDPGLSGSYDLDQEDLATVGVLCMPPVQIDPRLRVMTSWHWLRDVPYLIHTGYELPLMLEGRKPLAAFTGERGSPWLEEARARFALPVQSGRLVERMVDAAAPGGLYNCAAPLIVRRLLYAVAGQQWRIDAYLDLWEGKAHGWSPAMERREGELLGYEDWQNDWWANHKRTMILTPG